MSKVARTIEMEVACFGDKTVEVKLPRCPRCGSAKYRVYKTRWSSPNVRQQYAQCKNAKCRHKFQILAE